MSVLAIHDPDALIRHRGIRVGIVMPAVFALGVVVLDNPNLGLFGAFGAFAMLGFADFGGDPGARTRAYLVLTAIGIVMVGLGTVVSQQIVAGAVLLALVTFAIRLASVYGGYFAAGGPAALLLFVIAVMVPAPIDELASREIGWVLASVVSIAIASVLWPVRARQQIRDAAADVAETLAAVVRRDAGGDARAPQPTATSVGTPDIETLHEEITALRDLYGRTDVRPAGPAPRDQAMVRLLDQLQRAVSFARRLQPVTSDDGLVAAVAGSFEHTAAVLRRSVTPALEPDLGPTRDAHRAELESWVASAMHAERPAVEIADRLRQTFPLRVLSHTALSCDGDAVLAMGGRLPPDEDKLLLDAPAGGGGVVSTTRRAAALLQPHLRPGSVVFRNALRGSAALAVALVVADLVHAEHGFWVVLGTLTVLRSSAMRTGITALQALVGNLLGFLVAGIGMVALGERTTALWLLLPVAAFLAAYAPSAIHFVVGQASFTVLVVILFNILQPEGWRTGLVRVESVALGATVSLAVGALFWPRGNRQALHDATARFYRSVAAYVGSVLGTFTRPDDPAPDEVSAARRSARAAELRADEALFDLLATPNPTAAVPAWARLTSVGRSLRLVGDGIRSLSQRPLAPLAAGVARRELDSMAVARIAEVAAVGDRIAGSLTGEPARPRRKERTGEPDPVLTWLGDADRDDPEAVGRAVTMVWAVEWIEVVDALVELDDEPLAAIAGEAMSPWWR